MRQSVDKSRKYGCRQCGKTLELYPPDDIHVDMMLQPCEKGDAIKMTVICPDCRGEFPVYWDEHHLIFASG